MPLQRCNRISDSLKQETILLYVDETSQKPTCREQKAASHNKDIAGCEPAIWHETRRLLAGAGKQQWSVQPVNLLQKVNQSVGFSIDDEPADALLVI